MEYGNGEIEKLVHTIDALETRDSIVKDILIRFQNQSRGIQNKLIECMANHLQYYKKKDLNDMMKSCQITILETIELNEDEEIKPYILIGDEVLKHFHILTLITHDLYAKPIMMVFYGNSYHRDLTVVKQFISKEIVKRNVSHIHTYNDVLHYISMQTQFDPEKLNYDGLIMIFQNGIYDFRVNNFLKQEEAWRWYYFYEIPHSYKEGKFDCRKFKKAIVMWLDKKTTKGYRLGHRTVLLNDVFESMSLSMTTNMGFRTSFLNYGEPRCGKSQFFNIVIKVVGKENISNTSLQRLGKNEFGAEGMEFKILNYNGDLPSQKVEDQGTYKNISGGDTSIESERKLGAKHNVRYTCKFWFNANKVPKLANWDDDATYDRFVMYHFCNQFNLSEEGTINDYWSYITSDSNEIQGIIHECVKAYKRLLKRGGFRQVLKENTRHTWNYTSNIFYAFLYDFCEKDKKERINVDEFHEKFTEEYPGTSKNSMTKGLFNLGITKKEGRIKGTKDKAYFYYGVKWKDLEIKTEQVDLDTLLSGTKESINSKNKLVSEF